MCVTFFFRAFVPRNAPCNTRSRRRIRLIISLEMPPSHRLATSEPRELKFAKIPTFRTIVHGYYFQFMGAGEGGVLCPFSLSKCRSRAPLELFINACPNMPSPCARDFKVEHENYPRYVGQVFPNCSSRNDGESSLHIVTTVPS